MICKRERCVRRRGVWSDRKRLLKVRNRFAEPSKFSQRLREVDNHGFPPARDWSGDERQRSLEALHSRIIITLPIHQDADLVVEQWVRVTNFVRLGKELQRQSRVVRSLVLH